MSLFELTEGMRMVLVNRVIVLVSIVLLGGGALLWGLAPMPQMGTSEHAYSIVDRGGVSLETRGGDLMEPALTYARIEPSGGSTTPSGFGIFGFRNSAGELTTEASVSATPLIRSGRVFVAFTADIQNTSLAIVNPHDEDVRIDFFFSDSRREQVDFGAGTVTIGAKSQIVRFISEAPFNAETGTRGALTLTASLPVSVAAFRQSFAGSGESIFTSMPVADLGATSTDTVFLPHFVFGGPWSSRLILLNPTDGTITGRIGFISQGSVFPKVPGITTAITLSGVTATTQDYELTARGFREFSPSLPPFVQVGSFRVVPDEGNVAPIAQLIVSNTDQSFRTVSEATVLPAELGTGFRMFVEFSGEPFSPGFLQTGLAIASVPFVPTLDETRVTLELTGLDGAFIGGADIIVPPSGQRAFFVNEAFASDVLVPPFQGVLRLTATDGIVVVGLRVRTNERGQSLVTNIPVTNEAGVTTTTELFFPFLVNGGSWSSQTVLFSGIAGQVAEGVMRFFGMDGSPFEMILE